jgi:hypothetical protein
MRSSAARGRTIPAKLCTAMTSCLVLRVGGPHVIEPFSQSSKRLFATIYLGLRLVKTYLGLRLVKTPSLPLHGGQGVHETQCV